MKETKQLYREVMELEDVYDSMNHHVLGTTWDEAKAIRVEEVRFGEVWNWMREEHEDASDDEVTEIARARYLSILQRMVEDIHARALHDGWTEEKWQDALSKAKQLHQAEQQYLSLYLHFNDDNPYNAMSTLLQNRDAELGELQEQMDEDELEKAVLKQTEAMVESIRSHIRSMSTTDAEIDHFLKEEGLFS